MKSNKTLILGTALLLGAGFGVSQLAVAGGGMHPHAQQILKQADKNADGVSSVEEVAALQREKALAIDADKNDVITGVELDAHRALMRAEKRNARLMKLDANQDGRVSVDEFAAKRIERVKQMDSNGDGVLDANDHLHGGFRGHHR